MSKKGSNPPPPQPTHVQNGINRGANINPPPPSSVKPPPPPAPPQKK